MRQTFIILFSGIILGLLTGCSNRERDKKAEALGVKDAEELLEITHSKNVDSLKVQSQLLEVRWKEHRMKDAGLDETAGKYIDAFTSTIAQKDSVLYHRIFDNE